MKPTKVVYSALAILAMATLAFEVWLTRVFSVVTWYHFAFMAISIAMFGLSVASGITYFRQHLWKRPVFTYPALSICSLLFAVSIVTCHLVLANFPLSAEVTSGVDSSVTFAGVLRLLAVYVVCSLPFIFAGIVITVCLTKFTGSIGRLYAADLLGAATGCIVIFALLPLFTASGTVIVIAMAAIAAAILFASVYAKLSDGNAVLKSFLYLASGLAAVAGLLLLVTKPDLLRIKYSKGVAESVPLFEKWNAFSRIRVDGNPNAPVPAGGWGLSTVVSKPDTNILALTIDGGAGTPITRFDGNTSSIQYLLDDVVNTVLNIRPDGSMMIIGAGGGRDILSGVAAGKEKITGVEINPIIIDAVTDYFGDFAGKLQDLPGVRFENAEGRNFAAGQSKKFDTIQISLIDTWAASAAGAYVLTENTLYTVEGFREFLRDLKPDGFLSVSRWYNMRVPTEYYRLVSLARETLLQIGIKNPEQHLIGLRAQTGPGTHGGIEAGTLLISPTPIAPEDIAKAKNYIASRQFVPLLVPGETYNNEVEGILKTGTLTDQTLRIDAPTDNSPFFFNMVRIQDIFKPSAWKNELFTFNLKAVWVLGVLFVIVVVLSGLFILVPIFFMGAGKIAKTDLISVSYFALVGLAFMVVEIALMQKLIVFLGHPIYGLTVVLFTLLASMGIGSYLYSRLSFFQRYGMATLAVLAVAYGLLLDPSLNLLNGSSLLMRILFCMTSLGILGLFLGVSVPTGLDTVDRYHPTLRPWLWGINGAASVVGSVLAIGLSIFVGISQALWVGVACYLLATFMIYLLKKRLVHVA